MVKHYASMGGAVKANSSIDIYTTLVACHMLIHTPLPNHYAAGG